MSSEAIGKDSKVTVGLAIGILVAVVGGWGSLAATLATISTKQDVADRERRDLASEVKTIRRTMEDINARLRIIENK